MCSDVLGTEKKGKIELCDEVIYSVSLHHVQRMSEWINHIERPSNSKCFSEISLKYFLIN